IKYCNVKKTSDPEAMRFFKLLTNYDNLQLMCFVADILFLLKNFQKKLQSDALTIVDIKPQVEIFTQKLSNMFENKMGWEETLAKGVEVNSMDHTKVLFGTELWEKSRRTKGVNRFVTDKRLFSSIRNDSIEALKTFMMRRMCFDDILNIGITSISAFTNFCATADDIRTVHSIIAPDVNLAVLAEEYTDIQLMDSKH